MVQGLYELYSPEIELESWSLHNRWKYLLKSIHKLLPSTTEDIYG
jgi:hypothetical protein